MSDKLDRLSFLEYYSDPLGLAELVLILSSLLLSYTFYVGYEEHFNFEYPSLPFAALILIVYSSVVSALFAKRLDQGIIGNIFTIPLRRKMFLRTTTALECVIMSLPLAILLAFLAFVETSEVPTTYILETFVLFTIMLFLTISTGKLIGSITKDAIATAFLTFLIFYALTNSTQYLRSNEILFLLSANFNAASIILPLSASSALVLLVLLLIASGISEAGGAITLHRNLKNGR